MNHSNLPQKGRLGIRSNKPPVVEYDSASKCVYVRFSTRRVARTIDHSYDSVVLTVDVDSEGHAIGVEVVNFDVMNLHTFVIQKAKVRVSPEMLSRANFVRPGTAKLQEAS
jgi:uncharacterized protein YuzE